LLLIAGVAALIHHIATQTVMGLALGGNSISSSTLVANLSSPDRNLVMTSLDLLGQRKDPAGQQQARTLLLSKDDYIWFNAALYLGAINDSQAIPYLIKGLKHPASRAYPDVVRELQAITGQNFGMDQAKWIAWWQQQNPTASFSFKYRSLEVQAGSLATDSQIRIDRVIDPVTVDYSGSPITLIGLRLKAGANLAAAKQLLETAIVGQFISIERDGTDPMPDSSVPVLADWVPDAFPNPTAAAFLRQGLGPVPFQRQCSIQQYLLQSGLYELDLSNVHDPALRTKLQSSAPTAPATSPTTQPH
jgi:hypothetical protein